MMFRSRQASHTVRQPRSVSMASRPSSESFKIAYHHNSGEYLCQQEITGKQAPVEGNLQMPAQLKKLEETYGSYSTHRHLCR